MKAVSDTEFASEWEHNYVLTWSGRWHIADVHYSPEQQGQGFYQTERRTLCGAYGYTRDQVPSRVERLQNIKTGAKTAPTCKKCERKAKS